MGECLRRRRRVSEELGRLEKNLLTSLTGYKV